QNPLFKAGYSWQMIAIAVNPYLQNKQVWACPSTPTNSRFTVGPANDRFVCSLAYNEYLYNTAHAGQPSYDGGWNNLSKLASTKSGVASLAVMADSGFPGIFNDWSDFDGYRFPGEANDFGMGRLKYANWWDGTNPATPRGSRHT